MNNPPATPSTQVLKQRRLRRQLTERTAEWALTGCGLVAVATTVAIVAVLVREALPFFEHVSLWAFLTDTMWTPLFADPRYGILPLVSGTLTVAGIALAVAVPMGTVIAIYLSEFAPPAVRETIKPVLEMLEAVPTVVFGYFALLFVTPLLQATLLPNLPGFNMLSAGLVIGVFITPYISSLSEDAMRAVPMSLREGAYAMGSTKLQVAWRVVAPAAVSGIVAAYVLAVARAIGETMVVAIAAGLNPKLTFDPTESAATITAYIAQVAMGDLPHGSVGYQSIFAAGLTLVLMTLALNLAGHAVRRKYGNTR
jgi:phosphate transport system permease protein